MEVSSPKLCIFDGCWNLGREAAECGGEPSFNILCRGAGIGEGEEVKSL